MLDFKNVTVIKKANVYFDGKVSSRTIVFADKSKKTLGIMLPGEYEFNTDEKELMEIHSGKLEVLLSGSSTWQKYSNNMSFEVPEKSKFKLKVYEITDYCCSFFK